MTLLKANIAGQDLSGYILKSLYNANTVLAADTDDTPAAVELTEQTVLGRLTSGKIKAISVTELKIMLSLSDYALTGHNHSGVYSPVGHGHGGVYEPVLGNPAITGWILSSTDAGVRSWIAPTGGGATVALDNLASIAINTSLISDADNTDDLGSLLKSWNNTFSNKVYTTVLAPHADGVTALQITKADGTTVVLNVDTTNGRLGINTNAPGARVEVKDSPESIVRITGNRADDDSNAIGSLEFYNANNSLVLAKLSVVEQDNFAANGRLIIYTKTTDGLGLLPAITIDDNGEIGLGRHATNPSYEVEIGKAMLLTSATDSVGASANAVITLGPNVGVKTISMRRTSTGGKFVIDGWTGAAWAEDFSVDPVTGFIGIGTSVPDSKLTINKNVVDLPAPITGTIIHVGQANAIHNYFLMDSFGSSAANHFLGRRSMGSCASPSAIDAAGRAFLAFEAEGYGTTEYSSGVRASFALYSGAAWTDSDQSTYIAWMTTAIGSKTQYERMRIDPSGNVGIGNTVPAEKLDVTGNIKVSGTVNGQSLGWRQTTGTFTATPASTSTLTMTTDLTATILVGMSLSYVIGGVTYYGQVDAITSILLTVRGAPLGGDVIALYFGGGDITQVIIGINGLYEDASNTDLILSDNKIALKWQREKSYCVYYEVYSVTHDKGAHGQASVQINNTEVNTTAGGLTIAADATVYKTVVDIATAAYDINKGEELEVTSIKGGDGNATHLTVCMVFITP